MFVSCINFCINNFKLGRHLTKSLLFLILCMAFILYFNGLRFLVRQPMYDYVPLRRQWKPHGTTDLHVFSVVAINTTEEKKWNVFAVNTWINYTGDSDILCCYLMVDGAILTEKPVKIHQRKDMFNSSAQIECETPQYMTQQGSSNLFGVTITITNQCPNTDVYIRPYFPFKPTQHVNLAICGKLVYDEPNLELILEWMEYNKYMGVDKIVLYSYKISSVISRVLTHYQQTGLLDVIPFYMPFADDGPHSLGGKTTEAWNDEQVVVYDCQSRLRGYDYVAVIDVDEFIVPVVDRNFKNMLGRLMYVLPNMAAIDVYSEMYILDWGRTNAEGKLIISQYENRTASVKPIDINQRKLVHIPARIQRGSVVTHGCKVLNASYVKFKDPTEVFTINHYRRCVLFRDDCFTRARITDRRISRFLKKVITAVENTRIILNNISHR